MSALKNKFAIIILLVFIAHNLFGQMYQFKEYNIEEGLSHPFVYTVSEDKDGFIWIGTSEGLCKFDGFNFVVSEIDDTLTNGFVASSFLDDNGILWFGHNSGQITWYNGNEFKLLETSEDVNSTIVDIIDDDKGNVFIATQNSGIIKVNSDFEVDIFSEDFSGELIYSIQFAGNNNFLIGTSDGLSLYTYKDDSFIKEYIIKELEYILVQSIDEGNEEGVYWIGTEDSGFFLLESKGEMFDSYELINLGEKHNIQYENVQSVLEDQENILWISTFGKGVYKLIPDNKEKYVYNDIIHYSTANGLPNNFVKTVYQDWEGNYWIGTFGNGLAFSVDEAFTIQYQNIDALNGNILSIAETESYLWLGGNEVIVKVDKNNNEYKVINQANGLPKDKIIAIYPDSNENLWLGSEKNGIYHLNTKTNNVRVYYRSDNSMGNSINHITGIDNKVWVSTQNGVLVFDLNSGKRELFNTSQGMPHNDIKFVFVDSEKNPWIATKSRGIFVLGNEIDYSIEGGNINLNFTSITEDANGNYWAVTYGDGVFKFEEDSITNFSTDNGLKSNYCYSIISDNAEQVWIGHRLGMSSIDINTGEIKIYGTEKGITGDCNNNATIKQKNGVILTGTTDGLVVYDGSKEKQSIFPPKLNITEVLFSDKPVNFNNPINLPFEIYKLNIDYIGLSYSNPEGVSYQYKLDGYDLEWSNITESRVASYSRVEDGNYTFILKACNAEGYCVEKPLEIKISIRPPFWKTWWFITISIFVGISLIYWYIKDREKKQKALQEYLENELQIRTKEVFAQKEMLEIKNRDITDSINYAQRIQQSILPSVATINEYFSGAFVYYQPRDIVSGDFYWYDRVNDDKFLIVCADSTGHGVPGAFMSMIGTTLIKDICIRKNIDSPAAVLENLDKELQRTLNQNIDAERAHDGMDIIVCEIDINTNYMRFASAMRPLILYKDKKLQYVKGTKASIGGDPNAKKRFENIGFQLHQGDIIYMFSDGYPDQFGGPRGKKFKLDRVKNMLADVCDKPMDNQHDYVDNIFTEWRGKLQQVDDVLFMGVRI
ncbi:MAG: SpoIIE family protein phosphatase [Bacteroidales bacterium]|nr:SpoIIE family protein phosphatase [Bacteroidales bacterium]